ncbi:DUF3551 domain-containing protein [Bradyrhizobium sp. 157]|nr:DUF3551 domain-containing protein [Bradyrhizobium sp. 157]
MRLLTLAAATMSLAASFTFAGTLPSHADANWPVCSRTYGTNDGLRCDFQNFQQCRAHVSGMTGTCLENPRASQSSGASRSRRKPLSN